MGAELLEPIAKWGALLLAVLIGGWAIVHAIRSGAASGAVAKDDLKEERLSLEAIDKAEEVGRATPKTARSLREWLRGGRV